MKIAIIADSHIGKMNDNEIILSSTERFYTDIFFPRIKKGDIDLIVDLGDTFDHQRVLNYNTLARAQKFFFAPMMKTGCRFIHICGNHEVYFKDSNMVNAFDSLFGVNKPTGWRFIANGPREEDNLLFLPWITDDNSEIVMQAIKTSKAKYVFGHLALVGFKLDRERECERGMDADVFMKFDTVFSGHFHHKHKRQNIHYLGATGQYTWGDYGDERGFHVLDTETGALEFILNPYTNFHKVTVNNSIDTASVNTIGDKFVKVVVNDLIDQKTFESVIEKLEKSGSREIRVIENLHPMATLPDSVLTVEDTLKTIKNYAKAKASPHIDTKDLVDLMTSLYTEAVAMEKE